MSTRYKVVQDKLVAMQQTKLKAMLVYHSENPTALKRGLRECSQSFGKLMQMPRWLGKVFGIGLALILFQLQDNTVGGIIKHSRHC